jgi:hypothetical protein
MPENYKFGTQMRLSQLLETSVGVFFLFLAIFSGGRPKFTGISELSCLIVRNCSTDKDAVVREVLQR